MLIVEMKRMMKMRDYYVFVDAFLPESLICDGATIERACFGSHSGVRWHATSKKRFASQPILDLKSGSSEE